MGVDQLVTGGDFDDPVVDSLTSGSVKADTATINQSSVDRWGVEITQVTVPDGDASVIISDTELQNYSTIIVRFNDLRVTDTEDIVMTVNNETGTVYDYWDETGAKLTGQNSWLLSSPGGANRIQSGEIELSVTEDGNGRISMFNKIGVGRAGRVSGYSQRGGINTVTEDITQITVSVANAGTFNESQITVYGVRE